MRYPLGHVQKFCRECVGLVENVFLVLPAIAVNAKTHAPGPGFEAAYREWYPENAGRDICIIAEEWAKVFTGVDCGMLLALLSEEANSPEYSEACPLR